MGIHWRRDSFYGLENLGIRVERKVQTLSCGHLNMHFRGLEVKQIQQKRLGAEGDGRQVDGDGASRRRGLSSCARRCG